MRKNIKRIMMYVMSVIIFVSAFLLVDVTVFASSIENDEKIYCTATLDDDFSDDEVLIIINKTLSRNLNLNVSFENIDYLSIEDLTSSYDEKSELNENFRKIYKMTLKNSNKEKVLSTIKQLETIDYVYCAEPNYYDQLLSVPNDYTSSIQYVIDMTDLTETWDFVTGTSDVTVA